MDINAVKIGSDYIAVTNTCAFDSLLQILLTATYDFTTMENNVSLYKFLLFFTLSLSFPLSFSRFLKISFMKIAFLIQCVKCDFMPSANF